MYEDSLQDEFWELKRWGIPRVIWGQPKSFAFCISIGELDVERKIFPDIFVRVCCKKNYFLLQ